ncbi:MAG: 50S ribosomal protein L31 [Candidatus Margulisbacteria bacterium]|nr:50S ribosomal protein L31 [Candidatus Margulisiibacteriota bacterium]
MKKNIHPQVKEIVATCVCGAQYNTYSTKDEIRVDICGACHPFYTGSEKIMDTEGRVERFKRRYKTK